MPSRERAAFAWLLAKEARELLAARSFWLLLLAMGPLVGTSFISAVRTYAEASGLGGTSAGVGEAFAPLVGVWAPTFSACELASVFLLPFVAIRVIAGDRQSGALKLEMQHPMSTFARVAAKALVLLGAWVTTLLAPAAGLALWLSYGGTLHPPELVALVLGHVLDAGLTVGLAAAAAGLAEHPSTAAILTLGVTVGTWVLSFVAAIHGGIWERLGAYTPAALVSEFQHGLVRAAAVLVALALSLTGLALCAIWLRIGVPVRRRVQESLALAAVAAVVVFGATHVRASWDLSEDRANSFPRADEAALREIRQPLRVEAHLAPEDPRRTELERQALGKLRRLLPDFEVRWISATSIGLFEQSAAHYGEVWYEVGGRRQLSRSTTAEGVLEAVYTVAGMTPPGGGDDVFRGHPLATEPTGAGWVFYGAWPVCVGAAFLTVSRRT